MLRQAGYIAMSGQIVDASLVAAPRQRNTDDEKKAIKDARDGRSRTGRAGGWPGVVANATTGRRMSMLQTVMRAMVHRVRRCQSDQESPLRRSSSASVNGCDFTASLYCQAMQIARLRHSKREALVSSSKREGLAHCFFLKDCCALPDQMSFLPAFSWRRFVLAVRDRHRAYQNEIAIPVFGVTAKDFSHGVLLDREYRRFPHWALR